MSKEAPADVAVIIVNYGTADLALEALSSVIDHPARVAALHLIDNASPQGDAAHLAAEIAARGWQDRVQLHAEPVNHGFGRGNNLVIAPLLAASGPLPDKVFLLNPDARLANEAIALLAEFLDSHPQVGAVGARIDKPDAQGIPRPVTAAFRFPSLISTFAGALSFGPVSRLCKSWEVPLPPDLPSGPVDWVAGAAVMLRVSALRQAGAFDPTYFLYFEEVDLMRQMARTGWQTWYLAEAHVIHAEGAATGVKSADSARRRRPAYWYQSWLHYTTKAHGRAGALAAAALWVAGAGLNHAISALRRREPAAPLRFYRDLWTHALRPLLGLRGAA